MNLRAIQKFESIRLSDQLDVKSEKERRKREKSKISFL